MSLPAPPYARTTTTFGDPSAQANSLVLQADGKVVLIGETGFGSYSELNDFALARYDTDGRLDNTFGNNTSINVDCPPEKQIVEQTVGQLPHTGPRENMIFAGIVFAVVVYFYTRSRQVKKEIRLIRRDLNAGTI